jgi:hypothetical protein
LGKNRPFGRGLLMRKGEIRIHALAADGTR